MPTLTAFKTFQIVSCITICVLGTIGNALVILVVYRKRKMKTVTNYFIVNLAIADLAVLLINVPLDVANIFAGENWLYQYGSYQYGSFMCHVIGPLQTMATTASVWSLVAISISRYVAIVHPLKPQLRRMHAKWMIVPVWAISLVLVSPYMASLHMIDGECQEDFESAGMVSKYYTLGVFITQYVIPLLIMAFAYIRIAQELTKNPNHNERTQTHYKETKKVLKMLTIVVFVFAILVLPLHVVYIWSDFFNGNDLKYMPELHSVAVIMVYGNSFTNPIIYNACNEEFRKCFRGYFKAWIKPCARLVLGDRALTDEQAEILNDIGSTFHRTQGNGSFRRQSRRDTFTLSLVNTNNENSKKSDRKRENNHSDKTHKNTTNNHNSNTSNGDNTTVNACNHQTSLLHNNNINQQRNSTSYGNNHGVQYVSVL